MDLCQLSPRLPFVFGDIHSYLTESHLWEKGINLSLNDSSTFMSLGLIEKSSCFPRPSLLITQLHHIFLPFLLVFKCFFLVKLETFLLLFFEWRIQFNCVSVQKLSEYTFDILWIVHSNNKVQTQICSELLNVDLLTVQVFLHYQ